MIAIGGAIGTGLVIGSGTSLARSGPGSLFIAYVIMGMVSQTRAGRTRARNPTAFRSDD
jgi:L-asparagine transporter-like permease